MRIIILNWKDIKNPDVGGAEIILYELAKRLVKDGHKVTWFCRTFRECAEREVIDGIEVIRRGNKLSVYLRAWEYYRSLQVKPDKVIESVNTVCWQTPLYVPYDRRLIYVNQLAKEVFFYELKFPLSYFAYFFENWEYKTYKSSKFLCYSPSVKEDLIKIQIPEENISVFPLGLDHGRYKEGFKSDTPLFVFCARLVKMKRADLCVEAMRQVIRKYKTAKLALIGYGPEEKKLHKMIDLYGLSKNVYIVNKDNLFFEKNSKDLKVKLMQEAWALLLPSVKEGWGMVVTEAAACGTPSIVTDVTGLRDSVVDGKTGFIISKEPKAEEISSKMIKLIEDSNLRKSFFKNSVNWSNNFSWDKSYKRFYRLLG